MRSPKLYLIVALLCVSGVACAKARANTVPVMPELAPPPPPPRVVATFPAEPVPTIEPSPVDSALATPPPPITKPPAAKQEPQKAEPLPASVERPAPAGPALTIKPGPGVQAATEASIRAHLDRAQRDLQRVDYAALNEDGRTQFDTARRFIHLAEEALKSTNLPYASKLADKAATMAAVLVR